VTSSITNVFYDFHDSLESQVQNALQCSPIWFTENNDTINESEAVIKEGEKHETDSLPEVIDDLSTRPFKIIKKRRIRGSLRNDRRKKFLKKMLERFQRETGQLEAKAIYWKLLDRSRIPSEYDGIKIDCISMSRTEYFENPDIVDNIHFKPCTNDRPFLETRKASACIDDDSSEIDDSEHESEDSIEAEQHESNYSPEVIDDLSSRPKIKRKRPIRYNVVNERRLKFHKKMLERFHKETGKLEAKVINWKLLDRSCIPSEYDGIKIDSDSMSRAKYFENLDIVDNIHFKPFAKDRPTLKKRKINACIDDDNPEIDASENVLEEEKEKYEFNNSPEVIDNLSAGHHLVNRRKHFRKNILERFRNETGQLEAKVINWKLLDRSRIPSEYDGIEIDCVSMYRTEYFENPNIVDNIHFNKYRLDSKADASNIVSVDIKRRLLEIFCIDLGRPNASSIIWDRIDSDRLPEKYKNILLTSRTVYGQKFYEDPEFMENVHFKPYNKKMSKN
jgi:hypothetical protein